MFGLSWPPFARCLPIPIPTRLPIARLLKFTIPIKTSMREGWRKLSTNHLNDHPPIYIWKIVTKFVKIRFFLNIGNVYDFEAKYTSSFVVIIHFEWVVVLLKTHLSICRLWWWYHCAKYGCGTNMYDFFDKSDDFFVHVVREGQFDEKNSNWPTK